MPDTLTLLHLEHGNLAKVLGLIEDEAAAADSGTAMDAELLGMASEYFSDYPDRCHHPKEDLVYGLLGRRDPDARTALRDLIADHRRLHALAEAFGEQVRRLREAPQAAEPTARNAIRDFAKHYRQHMHDEETQFFPLAEGRLSRDDWATLDFAIFDQDDPLFDHAAEERFSTLRKRIESLAAQDRSRRTVLSAADGIRNISGIESFNEAMKSTGRPFRLARFVESGFGLERDRELLLYIPECSAERAAWCAYCYLLGREPMQ